MAIGNPSKRTSHRSRWGVFSHRCLRKASAADTVSTGPEGSAGIAVIQVIVMRYFGSRNILKIPHTLQVVTDCWESAEESLRTDIRADYPGVNEEFITQMFHGKLARALRMASEERRIERAFLVDL